MHNNDNKVTKLFNDSDPKVKALYDALEKITNEERFKDMSLGAIVGAIEFLKLKIML